MTGTDPSNSLQPRLVHQLLMPRSVPLPNLNPAWSIRVTETTPAMNIA
jgi:hypothetical protein